MAQLDLTLVVHSLNCSAAPDGLWCDGVMGGGLGEHVGCAGGFGASR